MKKILIVEDDRVLAGIYRSKLEIEGFDVSVAADGESAIQAFNQTPPDLVVLDLMLPKTNGIEVIKHIRQHSKTPDVPVIVFSNALLSSMVRDAWKAGATKFLTKHNCPPRDLIQAIRNALEESEKALTAKKSEHPPEAVSYLPEKEVREALLKNSEEITGFLRIPLQALAKADNATERSEGLQGLYRGIHPLTGNAGLAGCADLAQVCSALEAFLRELEDKPDHFNASTLRTIAQAVDLIPLLFSNIGQARASGLSKSLIMVLDDEKFSRRAICAGLAKVGFRAVQFENPKTALEVAVDNTFDLMFVDLNMPELSGADFCQRVRALNTNCRTPIVFVTSHTDFESRARTIISGGTDIIGKPFLFMEIAMKALIYTLKNQMQTLPAQVQSNAPLS